jgi:hypothetical protein
MKSVVNLYACLSDLLKASKGTNSYYASKELLLPGLSILPDALQQPYPNKSGRSPGETLLLVNKVRLGECAAPLKTRVACSVDDVL